MLYPIEAACKMPRMMLEDVEYADDLGGRSHRAWR